MSNPFRPTRQKERQAIRTLAREYTYQAIEAITSISQRKTDYLDRLNDLKTAIYELTKRLDAKGTKPTQSLLTKLNAIIRNIPSPPSDSDVIKASEIILLRGWGKPGLETLEPVENPYDETWTKRVRGAMIASAMNGDVSAQQAFLRTPIILEHVDGSEFDLSKLNDDDLRIFTELLEKMKAGESNAVEDDV